MDQIIATVAGGVARLFQKDTEMAEKRGGPNDWIKRRTKAGRIGGESPVAICSLPYIVAVLAYCHHKGGSIQPFGQNEANSGYQAYRAVKFGALRPRG